MSSLAFGLARNQRRFVQISSRLKVGTGTSSNSKYRKKQDTKVTLYYRDCWAMVAHPEAAAVLQSCSVSAAVTLQPYSGVTRAAGPGAVSVRAQGGAASCAMDRRRHSLWMTSPGASCGDWSVRDSRRRDWLMLPAKDNELVYYAKHIFVLLFYIISIWW